MKTFKTFLNLFIKAKDTRKIICSKSNFVALNAQINASNIGYHTIRNYKNFNTLIINEKEISANSCRQTTLAIYSSE